jgi:hypothetical protein
MTWVFWLTTKYSFVEGSSCTDLQEHFYPDGHDNRFLSSLGNHLTNYSTVTEPTTATNFTVTTSSNSF